MNLFRALAFIGTLFFCSHASAQVTCNPAGSPSGSWVQSYGSYIIGDVAIFGPGCDQLSDGGIQAATSITPISGATNVTSANCGTRFLPTVSNTGATYAITGPSAASLPTNCIISVTAPANRGVQLNFSGITQFILWPNQNITFVARSTGWIITSSPGLWIPQSGATLCVYKGGSAADTQDGLDSTPTADAGAGCLATVQHCVSVFYGQVNLASASPICALNGLNATTFSESVSFGGQLTGNNLLHIRIDGGALVWQSTTACVTAADNAEVALDINNSITFQCNTGNTAVTGAFKSHQFAVYDITLTAATTWIPGGSNDSFYANDCCGSATISGAGGLVIGDGAARSAESLIHCDEHCAKVTLSGSYGFSPNVTMTSIFVMNAMSFITTNATFPGAPAMSATTVKSGVLCTSGTTIPGTATATSPGVIFTAACN